MSGRLAVVAERSPFATLAATLATTPAAAPAVTAALALVVYLSTLPPDLTWANHGGDGGELITAAVTLGVPHPPGYPTYVLLGKVASLLPVGSVAYRFHLFSAVAMAAAAGLLTAVIRRATEGATGPAIAAGLLLAWSPLVWGQALIAEVYALNMAVVALLLLALVHGRHTLAGLSLGLGLTTHLTGVLLIPLVLWLTPRRAWPRLVPGFLMGLTPTLVIPFLAHGDSPVVWGEPTTLSGWWWLVSGELYRPNVLALAASAVWERLSAWLPIVARQMGLVGWLLVPFAFLKQDRIAPGALLTAGLYGVYALTYDSDDAIVNLLPALLLVSILLGFALERTPAAFLFLPLLVLGLNYSGQDLRAETAVADAATVLLAEAPPNAVLLTEGDPALFTLWYYRYVAGRRPDLIPVDRWLFAFDWRRERLRREYPTLLIPDTYDLAALRRANGREHPFCPVDHQLRLLPCD